MENKNIYWIIGIIVLLLFINSNTDLFATLESRFPSEIFYEKSYDLGSSGTIILSEGTNYSEVRKIEISVTGCGEDEGNLILNNEKIGSYKFTDCEYLTYPDGSGKDYIHYQTQTFTRLFYGSPTAPLLTSNLLTYQFTRADENIKAKRMIIYEKVECIVNSQCVQSAPFCDAVQHICLPKVTSCTNEWAPVCGSNGISYGNMCYSSMIGVSVVSNGLCPGDSAIDVKDEKNNQIDFTTLTYPIATVSYMWIYIVAFIALIIFLIYQRKNN